MRPSRSRIEHQAAVSRRLALLSAELAAVRAPGEPDDSGSPLVVVEAAPPNLGLVPVPRPGRHAARRGRLALGSAHLVIVAVAACLGIVVAAWLMLRASPREVIDVAAATSDPLVSPAGDSPAASPNQPTALVVDVAGRVRRPGIAVLEPGARVIDALKAAGGARPGVDLRSLNLARLLVDGEQILVGVDPGPVGVTTLDPSTGAAPTALVNLNLAGAVELEALPEVGPVTAAAIISWREEHGGFTSVDQLLDVDGIGEATLSQLSSLVTL